MLNVIMLNVIMLNVIMLNVIMLNVIMLNVVMLNVVVAPQNPADNSKNVPIHHSIIRSSLTKDPILISVSRAYF